MSKTRQIILRQGETLRTLAARELNTAARWYELAELNDLRMPYITETFAEADRIPGTAIWGDTILVPWFGNAERVKSPPAVFGTDVKVRNGKLAADAGDLALVSGADNAVQALGNRIKTMRGELTYHPYYGSLVSLALGLPNGPFSNIMATSWVQEAIKEEPRISSIDRLWAEATSDVVNIGVQVTMVGDNTPLDLNLVFNP